MTKRNYYPLSIFTIFTILTLFFSQFTFAQTTPNFTMRQVKCGMEMPWEITYGPDNFIWATEARGYKVSRINPATGVSTVLLDLNSKKNFPKFPTVSPQGGLMGLALHPDLLTGKPYVYLAYVYQYDGGAAPTGYFFKTKVVRYTYNAAAQTLTNEEVLCDTIPGSNDHNGGRMTISTFNSTPYLFYGVGDMGAGQFDNANRPNKAQDPTSYEGKILRFNVEPDANEGAFDRWIPNDFINTFGKAVFSIGHRNPQGLVNGNGFIYESEHGPYSDDELNYLGRIGINYGHPLVVGTADGNYNGAAVGIGTGVPIIVNEVNNATNLGNSYQNPIKSYFPTNNATIKQIYQNTVNNTPPVPNYFLSWNSIAPSGIDFYNSDAIPNWRNSVLITSLKRRRVYRLQMDNGGLNVVSDTIPLFADMGRYRDLALSPDGTKIYVSCDSEGQTSGATAGTTIDPPNKGCILEFTYVPSANPCAFQNCPGSQIYTPTFVNTQVATWTPPTLSSCAANTTVTSNYASGATFPAGSTTVIYTATEPSGSTITCSFNIVVNPEQNGAYCNSKSSAPWNEWISKVSLNTINNVSEKTRVDRYTPGYSDWTDKTTTLTKGQSYPLSILPSLGYIGNLPQEYCRVWIDFNANNVFEDSEKVLEGTNKNPFTSTVLIPATATLGTTRMRVSLKNGGYPTACELFANGEVEDYTVVIGGASTACVAPTVLCRDTTITIASNLITATVDVTNLSTLTTYPNPCFIQANSYYLIDGTPIQPLVTLPVGTTAIFRNHTYQLGGGAASAAICSSKVTINKVVVTTNLPDLTLANLNVVTPSVLQGQILNYKVDLKNIGTASSGPSFIVKSYLSVDPTLSADDSQIGSISAGNFNANDINLQVPGSLETASISVGQYYLILKIDADNQVIESNENNNAIVAAGLITIGAPTTTNYCASKGTLPWEYWISTVTFHTLNNISDKFKDFNTLGYSDYTNVKTTLVKGQSYPLSIIAGLSWLGNIPNTYCRVWIDFNKNNIFEDNEKVLEKTNQNPFTQTVLVPTTAILGETRMRVSVKNGAYPTACEVFAKGEVEDFAIIINDGTIDPCATDVTPPVFANCPQNINLAISGTRTFATWVVPTATDNCTPNPTVTPVVANPPFSFGLGSTEISYNATDAKGNRSTCRFNVVVTQSPTTILPDLTVSNFQLLNTTVKSGDSLKFNIDVTNSSLGGTPAGAQFFMRFYISTDNVLSANDIPANPFSVFADVIAQQSFSNLTSYISLPNGFAAGQYYLIAKIDADNNISESNENNNVVSSSLFTVSPTNTGNGDVALSITSTPSVFTKYTTQIFKIKAQNVGNQALTNVKIELKRPAFTSNGGAKVASVGTFSDYCAGGVECSEWRIPSLAAGATATLDAPFFILDANAPIVVTTKLLGSTPIDANLVNNSASVTVNPAAPVLALSRRQPTQFIPLIVESIAPNPTEGDLTIAVESLREQAVQFEFSNAMGQVIQSEKRALTKGSNSLQFDVWSLPQGVYFLQTDVNRGRISPTKFVKF
jgi:PQQ-dependent dehydrogenase (s-GDH family)